MAGVAAASLLDKIRSKTATVGVVGMGYIGLQLLDAFGQKGFPLVGFDVDQHKMECFKKGDSTISFLPLKGLFDLLGERFEPSTDPKILSRADIVVISVPTNIDKHLVPNFDLLRKAFETVAKNLRDDQLVIVQSTTYPGTTEDECLPLLKATGKCFYLGYVPEISDPGNADYDFISIPRMTSGLTPQCLEMVNALYESIGCKVHACASMKVAEAAKVYTNAYRLLNISFANEMKMLFDKMGMDVWEVIEAASSKPFGFEPFFPSPGAGGDCIPVDPSYLSWKGAEFDAQASLIDQSMRINQEMPHYVIEKLQNALNKPLKSAKILVLGVAFKKDINGLQESASLKILDLLPHADFHDPYIEKVKEKKGIDLNYDQLSHYDAVIIATDHSVYEYPKIVEKSLLVIDTRNATKGLSQERVVKA